MMFVDVLQVGRARGRGRVVRIYANALESDKSLLTALLYVPADELLGVLLQDRVDFVEQVVDVLGDLGVALGYLWIGLNGDVLDLLVLPALAGL
jgi:hypothetical protein